MGRTKTLLLLSQLLVWGIIAAVLLLSSSVSVGMAGGTFPQPTVSGLDTLPAGRLAITTGVFGVMMALTSRLAP